MPEVSEANEANRVVVECNMTYIQGSEASQKESEQEGPEAIATKLRSCLYQFWKSNLVKTDKCHRHPLQSVRLSSLQNIFCPVGMNPQVLLLVPKLATSCNKQRCLARQHFATKSRTNEEKSHTRRMVPKCSCNNRGKLRTQATVSGVKGEEEATGDTNHEPITFYYQQLSQLGQWGLATEPSNACWGGA